MFVSVFDFVPQRGYNQIIQLSGYRKGSYVPLIEALLLLLVLSRTIGEISEHLGQPAMIGEIAAVSVR